MRNALLLMIVGLVAVPGADAAGSKPARSTVVQDWVEVGMQEIAAHRTNPPRAARVLAHLSAAQYAAAARGGGARDAAISGAAAEVLSFFYPDREAHFDAIAGTGDGVAFGRLVGDALVERARTDGADAVWAGSPPSVPGTWVPTPPAFAPTPLEPLAG